MSEQVEPPRISENPDLYRDVYEAAMSAVHGVKTGAIENQEGTTIARNLGVAIKTLDGDLKSRLVAHRLAARSVSAPQIAGQKAS